MNFGLLEHGCYDAELWSGVDRFGEPRRLSEMFGLPTWFEGFALAIYGNQVAIAAPPHDADVLLDRFSDEIKIIKIGENTLLDWLLEKLPQGGRLWIDRDGLTDRHIRALVGIFENSGIVCILGQRMRAVPVRSASPDDRCDLFRVLPEIDAFSRMRKLQRRLDDNGIRKYLFSRGVVPSWMLGLRPLKSNASRIIPGHLLLEARGAATLFTDANTSPLFDSRLQSMGVSIKKCIELHYELTSSTDDVHSDLGTLPSSLTPTSADDIRLLDAPDFSLDLLPVASPPEISDLRIVHHGIGKAFVETMAEAEPFVLKAQLTELDLHAILEEKFRSISGYLLPAFPSIIASGPRSAYPHPDPPITDRVIEPNDVVLIDIGVHSHLATTDMTRTVVFGQATHEVRRAYTAVARALLFASNHASSRREDLTSGVEKILAREGFKLSHGVRHGVVPGLRVHAPEGDTQLEGYEEIVANTIVAIEPGVYQKGRFGVRLENMLRTSAERQASELLTCAPFSQFLILRDRMTSIELDWLDRINYETGVALRDELSHGAVEWLARQTGIGICG